jgi:hypothetical protein
MDYASRIRVDKVVSEPPLPLLCKASARTRRGLFICPLSTRTRSSGVSASGKAN